MAQNPKTLKVEEKTCLIPPLEDIAKALREGLASYFENATVDVVDCPDLTRPPFCLAASGLCGSPCVVEVGGVSHFMPMYQPDKVYDMRHFPGLLGVEPAALIGTGAGPFIQGHQCCEVLKIHCKKTLKDEDFPAAVRKCLAHEYKGQHLGLGGVFVAEGSKVRQHIPPLQFSSVPITTPEQLNSWLQFFDMNAPLVFVGTILTDNMDMDMILQHFHSFSQHGEGGHYHYDISPDSVEYLAYFSLAERAVHVDRPSRTSDLSVDNIMPTGTSH